MMKNRFHFIGFTHGTPEQRDRHFHFLLHTPLHFFKNEFYKSEIPNIICMDFLYKTLDRVDTKIKTQIFEHFERQENSLIKVTNICDENGIHDEKYNKDVCNYHVRKMKKQLFLEDDCHDFFFVS